MYLLYYRVELFLHRLIDYVFLVVSDAGFIGGYYNDVEVVYLHKLFAFGSRRAGHS